MWLVSNVLLQNFISSLNNHGVHMHWYKCQYGVYKVLTQKKTEKVGFHFKGIDNSGGFSLS